MIERTSPNSTYLRFGVLDVRGCVRTGLPSFALFAEALKMSPLAARQVVATPSPNPDRLPFESKPQIPSSHNPPKPPPKAGKPPAKAQSPLKDPKAPSMGQRQRSTIAWVYCGRPREYIGLRGLRVHGVSGFGFEEGLGVGFQSGSSSLEVRKIKRFSLMMLAVTLCVESVLLPR